MRNPFAVLRAQPGARAGLVTTGHGRLKAKVGMVEKRHENWKWKKE